MASKQLAFDTGLVEYTINGRCTVTFNPTDTDFAHKLYTVFDDMGARQEHYQTQVEQMEDQTAIFGLMAENDRWMREKLDGLFGVPICADLFGTMNVHALANGFPVWANLLLAIMDEMDVAVAREQEAANPRVQKYLAKYKRK